MFAESPNGSAELCHETGAVCEAHKFDLAVTASVCVSRETERDPFVILTPMTRRGAILHLAKHLRHGIEGEEGKPDNMGVGALFGIACRSGANLLPLRIVSVG